MATRPARPGSQSSPATRRWLSAAAPTACLSPPPASGAVRADFGARGPATASLSGTIGDHGFAVLVARGDLRLESTPRERHRAAERARPPRSPGSARDYGGCATRPGRARHRDERVRRHQRVWPSGWTSRRSPSVPRSRARAEILGIDPLYVANEGKLVAVVAPPRRRTKHCASPRRIAGGRRRDRRRGSLEPPGLVFLDTALGGSSIVDMLVGDPLPRIC